MKKPTKLNGEPSPDIAILLYLKACESHEEICVYSGQERFYSLPIIG